MEQAANQTSAFAGGGPSSLEVADLLPSPAEDEFTICRMCLVCDFLVPEKLKELIGERDGSGLPVLCCPRLEMCGARFQVDLAPLQLQKFALSCSREVTECQERF